MQNKVTIETINLVKKFGSLTAVSDLNLQVYEKEIFGLLGPNGAGKSTSINMICGLLKSTSGEVLVMNEKITKNKKVKSLIGVCPQENIFWPRLSCREQLLFMGKLYNLNQKKAKQRSEELLELLGLNEKSNTLGSKLSGGMKRRLNIGLALVHDPPIIIFDEPEAGLDPQSRILVRDYIKSLKKEKTVILTTHNMDEADRLADRVAIIDHGKLLMLDTPGNLKQSIGDGDILEIIFHNKNSEQSIANAISQLLKISSHVHRANSTIVIKTKNLVEKLNDITGILKSEQIEIKEFRMRENTLEDVFIHLTGRKLRQ
ncbi:MAG: ATP-binding cassette domain-containing protein [Bacteroidales bacterium]|nr:ATP-binding cassette domain-containing protein [Bacteroidales bacterium]